MVEELIAPANNNDEPIKAGVIGYPISHSLSPVIHGYWLEKYGINGTYDAIEVKPEELEEFFLNLPRLGLSGINVTLPHKEKAMEYIGRMDNVEAVIGAINTIWVDPETNELDGNNTDYYGFYKNLMDFAPDFDFAAGPALVLGAGGASGAVIAALVALCNVTEIIITNRTRETAEKKKAHLLKQFEPLKDDISITVIDWEDKEAVLPKANMVVNTTSLGMKGKPDLEIDLQSLNPKALVTDIVYNPLKTDLLTMAEAQGNVVVDGIGMLLHQAVLGFHKWFGVEPEVTQELRELVLAELAIHG